METIRIYIDNMFAGIKMTDKVKMAKEELFEMMEDKYHDLIQNGKSENEAVGMVISEFGNLDEVSETLGLEGNMETYDSLTVTIDNAKEYFDTAKSSMANIALGVFLCIIAITPLIILESLIKSDVIQTSSSISEMIGLIFLFVIIASAVAIFIINGSKLGVYDKYKTESLTLTPDAKQYVLDKQIESRKITIKTLAVSVPMYIISVVPFIIISSFSKIEDGLIESIAITVLLLVIGLATYFIIRNTYANTPCEALLEQDEYKEIMKKTNKKIELIIKLYWSIVLVLYLGYSFITSNWEISWVIWPVAGLLEAVIKNILAIKYEDEH